jgi:ribosome-associated protein
LVLEVTKSIKIPDEEIKLSAIRAQGAGGQKVNKTSSAIHLRFDIVNSSINTLYKERLYKLKDNRISDEGVIVIKAQQYRSLEQNRIDALERLRDIVFRVTIVQKKRRPTKATKGSQRRRMDSKTKRGKVKLQRGKIDI